jgi:carbonic anhydrase
MNMRKQTNRLSLVLAGLLLAWPAVGFPADNPSDSFYRLMREASIALLKEGNIRFATGHPSYPNMDAERRHNTTTEGQQPFATVLACSDSRDPVELIFDRGIGDIFVVRVAGNVAGISELATIEYGVGHLNTPLLVVMGHSSCGAVTAVATGAELHGFLPKLAEKITPAVARAKEQGATAEELVSRSIEANVWQAISDILRQSGEIRECVLKGKVQVVGALYDLETGMVKWLGVHPNQKSLLSLGPQPVEKKHTTPTTTPPPHYEPAAKTAKETNSPAKPAAEGKPAEEPLNTIDSSPGLDIDFGTSSVLPANKKKSEH